MLEKFIIKVKIVLPYPKVGGKEELLIYLFIIIGK